MKNFLKISQEEKKYILEKYSLLKEIGETNECLEGDCNNGKGKLKYKDGNIYEGNFVNGKREGQGKLTYPDGDIFVVNFKNDFIDGQGIYKTSGGIIYDGKWTEVNNYPVPLETDTEFKVFWPDNMGGYTYIGIYTDHGMDGEGVLKFPDGTNYTGTFKQTDFSSKIQFDGTDSKDSSSISTEDLIGYHTNTPLDDDEEEGEVVNDEEEGEVENVLQVTDGLRKNWKGCKVLNNNPKYDFTGLGGGKDYGYFTQMPELGYAKFKGQIDGKEVTIEYGCFDKFKIVRGRETGDRGSFEGEYYTEDTEGFFKGDETKANKFALGELKNSPEYDFYSNTWIYFGYFTDGKINGDNSKIPGLKSDKSEYGKITFNDNNTYSGDFVNSNINGNGTFTFSNGMVLSGFFTTKSEADGDVISVNLTETYKQKYGLTRIEDIFDFNETYDPNKKPNPQSDTIGAIKVSTLKGKTYYKIKLESKITGKSKEFESLIGGVFIRITNNEDKKIFFETTSDVSGNFEIRNIPFGEYNLEFLRGDKKFGFVFEKDDYKISKDTHTVNVKLAGTKRLVKDLNRDIKIYDKSKTNEYGKTQTSDGTETFDILSMDGDELYEYLESYLNANQKDRESWIQDLVAGRFEKKYGEVTSKEACLREFKSYADIIRKITKNEIDPEKIKQPGNDLQPTKNYLKQCLKTYGKDIVDKDDVKIVVNPPGEAYELGVRLENKIYSDIYNKTSDMGIYSSIRKVLKEQKTTNNIENNIIKNRLNFIYESSDYYDLKFNLLKESKELIKKGYNENMVKNYYKKLLN
jgi:hypothetical protein